MSGKTYYQRNMIPNKGKDYYENNKQRLREQVRDKNTEIYLKKKKNKKREYGKNRYHNIPEEKSKN